MNKINASIKTIEDFRIIQEKYPYSNFKCTIIVTILVEGIQKEINIDGLKINSSKKNSFIIEDKNKIKYTISNKNIKLRNLREDYKNSESTETYSQIPIVLRGKILNQMLRDKILRGLKYLEYDIIRLNDYYSTRQRLKRDPKQELISSFRQIDMLITEGFISFFLLFVRRIIDQDERTSSLMNLLYDIIKLDCFGIKEVSDDICKLKKETETIKMYCNNFIAHRKKSGLQNEYKRDGYLIKRTITLPTMEIIEVSINLITQITEKYIELLTSHKMQLKSLHQIGNIYYTLTKQQ